MTHIPKALQDVIDALTTLPGVGQRSAERYAYSLLKRDNSKTLALADALGKLHSGVRYCPITYALIDADEDVSRLYNDPKRDKQTIAVVEDVFDVIAIENTGQFKGTYHVLGGLISPIDGVNPDMLHIQTLLKRVDDDGVKEIILATNASVEGESTALFIQKQFEDKSLSVTRLAQGLPIGLDLEYADQITLGRALQGRRAI